MHRLHSYIAGSHNELILVSLRLFNAMSRFAAGQYRKSVLENFPWELKVGSYFVLDGCFLYSFLVPPQTLKHVM
jgi:hypothetical protein